MDWIQIVSDEEFFVGVVKFTMQHPSCDECIQGGTDVAHDTMYHLARGRVPVLAVSMQP